MSAKAITVRAIVDVNGAQAFTYTYGTPPLPANETGGIDYPTVDIMKERIDGIVDKLGEEGLLLLLLSIVYLKPDGSLANTNQVLNKTLTLDPFAAQPLRIT